MYFSGTAHQHLQQRANAGDKYVGLDRFGRIADQNWTDGSTAKDRLQYSYDRDSNPTTTFNPLSHGNSQSYAYDAMDRLSSYDRGTMSAVGGTIASSRQGQSWTLDSVGNWATSTYTVNGSTSAVITDVTDSQNRLTAQTNSVTGSHGLTYDYNGNEKTDASGDTLAWDAWNHLANWTAYAGDPPSPGDTITYYYDGLGRRAFMGDGESSTASTVYVSSARAQTLVVSATDDTAGGPIAESDYVYAASGVGGPTAYVDELVLRDDLSSDGGIASRTSSLYGGGATSGIDMGDGFTFDGRVYVRQAANFDVTSTVASTDGGSTWTTERYLMDPYGANVQVLQGDFSAKSGGTGWDWHVLHQGLFYDATNGLYYNRARWYDAVQGRFISQDPKGWPDGANRSTSRGDNAIRYVDSSGEFLGAALGAIVGGVAGAGAAALTGGDLTDIISGGIGGAITGGLIGLGVPPPIAGAVGGAVGTGLDAYGHGKSGETIICCAGIGGAIGLFMGGIAWKYVPTEGLLWDVISSFGLGGLQSGLDTMWEQPLQALCP